MNSYPQKWRPTLSMIVMAMLAIFLALPLGSFWLFRFYDNQLVKETESELIAQGAFVSAMVSERLTERLFKTEALTPVPVKESKGKPEPFQPQLDLATAKVLPRRVAAVSATLPANDVMRVIGEEIRPVVQKAQDTTLAGFRVLDHKGTVIMGSQENGMSLAHVTEVKRALSGRYASTIRERRSKNPSPPIYSISRGTNIRVFVAMPIEYRGHVAGVVYMSRTPSHFLRELYAQRWKVIVAGFFVLATSLTVALIFIRAIKGPIEMLNRRSQRIAEGDRSALMPLERHGTREIANLSKNLLSMARKLQEHSDYIGTFANHVSHELKSPITSMRGAAELLLEGGDEVSKKDRERFLANIKEDTERLSRLLDRLRDLARADSLTLEGSSQVDELAATLQSEFGDMKIENACEPGARIPLPREAAMIILTNLAGNSAQHGASTLTLEQAADNNGTRFMISDDGNGISAANREKIFDPFFTTRRNSGGTGMGLGIVRSILNASNGEIALLDGQAGTIFEITFPAN